MSAGAAPGPSPALERPQGGPKQGPARLDGAQGCRRHRPCGHHLPGLQPLWRGRGKAEGGGKAPGWGGRGGPWLGGCCSGRGRGRLPAAELSCPAVCRAPSAAGSPDAIGHGRAWSSIRRSTLGLPEMEGKYVLFLVKASPFPGWGESGSRHSRNIFSVYSLVIVKPHLRVQRSL